MNEIKIYNIIKFISNLNKFSVLLNKVYRRFFDNKGKLSKKENIEFLKNNISDTENFFLAIDENIWKESCNFSKKLKKESFNKFKNIQYDLGGGGAYDIIYFITRYSKPRNVLEGGVAAGYSSASFLEAINLNQIGHLYSSDFPYFRIKNGIDYIGILVPEHLKKYWSLLVDGDKKNLQAFNLIIKGGIDLIHYDSDKTYNGRKIFFKLIRNKISEKTTIIFDDIQDNSFFYDYINSNKIEKWRIFKFEGKFVGIIFSINFLQN